mgnify:CR=1 FL=1
MKDHPADGSLNIASKLEQLAACQPWKRALVYPESRDGAGRVAYSHLTFSQLNALADAYAWGLTSTGIQPAMRVLLMVRPSLEFTALVFALLKIGAVPVLIDPGMGWRKFMACVAEVAPQGFLGVPAAHVMRLLFPGKFRSVKVPVTLGRRWFWGGAALADLRHTERGTFPVCETQADDVAAILFTTGSTGPAKGVIYTHRIFDTQIRFLRDFYGITPDEVDLPCFPLFGLFSTALGVTAIIPEMDPTRPADVDPERIIEAVNDHGVTYSFGSPALWRTVSAYCMAKQVRLPSLQRVYMAGAPIPGYLHDRMLNHVLPPGADIVTPYGATECLPVASFTGTEMLAGTRDKTARGEGICVGKPVPEATVRIIRISDEAMPTWDDGRSLPDGEIGEIAVTGPMVTPAYLNRQEQTELAKIHDGDRLWHRMGDLGYLDAAGRLWVCGRKSHRVITADVTLFTVCCEAIFNEHPDVYRSALVGIGGDRQRQRPVIVIEPEPGKMPASPAARLCFTEELVDLARANPLTASIQDLLFHPAFPVDIRHNAKIRREDLAVWASAAVAAE